jgi:hypothetical protein
MVPAVVADPPASQKNAWMCALSAHIQAFFGLGVSGGR